MEIISAKEATEWHPKVGNFAGSESMLNREILIAILYRLEKIQDQSIFSIERDLQ